MFHHILCPVDLSPTSPAVVRTAAELAAAFGARITALYVSPLPIAPGEAPNAGPDRARVARELAALVEPAAEKGLRIGTVVAEGEPGLEILTRAALFGADLIVMGLQHGSRFERWVVSAVTERILREARCSVVTVSGGVRVPTRGFRTVLCAESLAPSSRAIGAARSLLSDSEAHLIVLHAVEELPLDWKPGAASGADGRLLEAAAEQLWAATGDGSEGRAEVLVLPGPAPSAVVTAASERKVDLIVLGRHDRAPFDATYLGSTARLVVCEADCPVLSVRGDVVKTLVGRLDVRRELAGRHAG